MAIVGAGFSGLWTAYYLLRARPELKVTILESHFAGYGASGRNGGGCSGRLGNQRTLWASWDRPQRAAMRSAQSQTLGEIESVLKERSIDCDLLRSGSLTVATGPEQEAALMAAARELAHEVGGEGRRWLDRDELDQRVRISGALGAIFEPEAAVLHPGKLVRALARTVEEMGATIFEGSEVERIVPGAAPRACVADGELQAQELVLSCESYLCRLPGFERSLVPITSSIVLSNPLSDADWAEIGWQQRELLTDFRLSVLYLQRTRDGRILVGGRGAPYRFRSSLSPDHNGSPEIYEMLRETGRRLFPALRRVGFSHAWSGALGTPRDYHPSVGHLPERHLLVMGGYTGTGVGPSNLFGRIAADLLLGNRSELTRLPVVGWRWRSWEPEPLRWLGIRYVQRRLLSLDARSRRTGRAPRGRSLAERWRPR